MDPQDIVMVCLSPEVLSLVIKGIHMKKTCYFSACLFSTLAYVLLGFQIVVKRSQNLTDIVDNFYHLFH